VCVQWFQSEEGRGLVIGAVWGGEYDDGEESVWGVNITVGVWVSSRAEVMIKAGQRSVL
jgi:hypothetical protein